MTTLHATNRFGAVVPTFDEGFDDSPIFVYLDSFGPRAIVRAQTWYEAWGICEDRVLPDADPDDDYNYEQDFAYNKDGQRVWHVVKDDDGYPVFVEGIGYRPNGEPTGTDDNVFNLSSYLYQEDLNFSDLDETNAEALESGYGITLTVVPDLER